MAAAKPTLAFCALSGTVTSMRRFRTSMFHLLASRHAKRLVFPLPGCLTSHRFSKTTTRQITSSLYPDGLALPDTRLKTVPCPDANSGGGSCFVKQCWMLLHYLEKVVKLVSALNSGRMIPAKCFFIYRQRLAIMRFGFDILALI